ncbi:MAG: VanW family protein [Myxococcaceae bacterium]
MAVFGTRLSELHPALYSLAVWKNRARRFLRWTFGPERWASSRSPHPLPFRLKRHSSRLLKHLGDTEMRLQHNKVRNLTLALPCLTGALIGPGETFSFCRLVGRPTRRRGFVLGLELAHGRPREGIGGGLCQLSNLIHWLVLHSPLTVTERSEHSFDPFPDRQRSIPFGTGAAIFYNYLDLQFRNDTPATFQLTLWLTGRDLVGELRSDREPAYSYTVLERNPRFERRGNAWFRHNEIWRKTMPREGGPVLREERVRTNCARVLYATAAPRSSTPPGARPSSPP